MKRQLRDVKVVRGAEIGSDHYLVLMVIKLELKVEKPNRTRTGGGSIRVKKLRNREARWQFQAWLRRRYSLVRQMVGKDIGVAWEELKEGILRSADEVCEKSRVRRERCRTAWWSKEVQEAVRAKKLAYRRLLNQGSEEARLAYNEATKEAKVRVRKAQNEEWIRLGEEMEKHAKGMQKRFWSRVRVRAKEKETVTHIRGLDGELRSGEEAMNRWREHFENLLNSDAGSGEEATADGNEVCNDEGEIEVEEVERAVRKLKSEKAGGVCGIKVEMVKAGGYIVVQWLKGIFDIA